MTARVVVAGTHSGVGKTTVATGLMAAFAERGRRVAGFKVGPDFIDPSYHALATGRPGRNLDAFMSGAGMIAALFAHGAAGADLAIVEGVMGMFDGAAGAGELASTAQVAKLLDPLGIPVLGVLRRQATLTTPERHLGLVPVAERRAAAQRTVAKLATALAEACDLQTVAAIAAAAPPLAVTPWEPEAPSGPVGRRTAGTGRRPERPVRIGVASGPAFTFLYQENLELLEASGAELVPVDPTADESLPERVAGLYLGGGFPETHAEALAANGPLRAAVRRFAAGGAPVVAECGGLLYLARTLDGHPMCGVLPADGRMTERLSLRYRRARATTSSALADPGVHVRGHEFHYSRVEPAAGTDPAWLLDGERPEGFVAAGVHASYLHTHWAAFPEVPARLVAAARKEAVA